MCGGQGSRHRVQRDFAGLPYLRDKLGVRFKAGVVLDTGAETLPFGATCSQSYLDEFVFRHHRRRTPLAAFQTCLASALCTDRPTYRQIVQRKRTG